MHPIRHEPNNPLQLRDRAIQDRNQQITASQEVYRRLLREVSWAIQSIRLLGELGTGLAPPQQLPICSAREAQLRQFALNITTGGSFPYDLDLTTLQDVHPQGSQSDSSSDKESPIRPEALGRPPSAMDVELAEPKKLDQPNALAQVGTTPGHGQSHANTGHTQAHRSLGRGSPELITAQSSHSISSKPGPSREGRTHSTNLHPPLPNSKSSHQSPSAIHHHLGLAFSAHKPPIATAPFLPSESTAPFPTTSRFTSVDYASQLPPVPSHIITSRLSAAQAVTSTAPKHSRRQTIRSGLWVGPGGSEITKLSIKAQHAGVKSALRKNHIQKGKGHPDSPKLHNILTTADWKAMLDELQMTRALEVLERLKAEKAWAYAQIKKPRIALVQKAHWDHLLDEMTWLQVDFRQERRWKIATAHRVAKQVLRWHEADPIGKRDLQVKASSFSKLTLSTRSEMVIDNTPSSNDIAHQIVPPSNSRPCPLSRTSAEVAPGHHGLPSHAIKGSPESFRSIRSLRASTLLDITDTPAVEKSTTAATEAPQSSLQESRKALHQIKRSRIPIFEMAPDESLIDVDKLTLDGICAKPSGYVIEHVKLQKLFVDLPVFGDLDSRPDKRPDEASPHLGRITRIAPFLEAKPLLVSTLQPSRNCQGKHWRNLGSLSVDDVRDSPLDLKIDSSHNHTHIFSARKSKEVKESRSSPVPSSPTPTCGPRQELTWISSDEDLLQQTALAYEFNWKMIADIFNASLSRSTNKPVTARDCYDCWMRLHRSSKPVAQHDAPTLPPKSTSESNLCAVAFQPDPDVLSAEATEKNTPDEANGCKSSKRPSEPSLLFPNKRTTRDDALQYISRKLKEKRASNSPRPTSPTQPRQIVLTAHETHAQAIRPYMNPLEMSALKAERDRQTQAALEMAKRQQQMQHESLLHQARAAAVVAAAAQIPLRNASNKPSMPINGNITSRLPSQPSTVSFTSGRHNGLPGVTLPRQASQAPTRYVTSPPILSVGNRGTASPLSHPPSSHQARQLLLKTPSSTVTPVSTQPPIVPQLPSIPQAFRPKTPNSQSSAPSSTTIHHTPNGSASMMNGLHNNTMSVALTPVQVAQFIQQQHLHQQRSPEHQIHQQHHLHQQRSPEHQIHQQQHQQILLQQQMQQHFQHTHQAVPQVFSHQSPTHSHPNDTTSAPSVNNSASPLISSSSPLPQPPT